MAFKIGSVAALLLALGAGGGVPAQAPPPGAAQAEHAKILQTIGPAVKQPLAVQMSARQVRVAMAADRGGARRARPAGGGRVAASRAAASAVQVGTVGFAAVPGDAWTGGPIARIALVSGGSARATPPVPLPVAAVEVANV